MSDNTSNDGKTENFVIDHLFFHDSEYDDALGVPDSLEMTMNENDDSTNINSNDGIDNVEHPGVIPFSSIYDLPKNIKRQHYDVFIPGEDVHVNIIDNERSVTTHPLNPNLYTIEFRHGHFTWTIKKRYSHIQNLHNQLKIYRASLNIPFPTKSHKERRISLKSLGDAKEGKRHKGALPRFPNKPDVLVSYEQLDHRKKVLEEYLTNLLKIKIYLHHPETIDFLEVSYLSFIEDLGMKGKEGIVLKRTGSGARFRCNFCGLLESMCCIRCNHFCTSLCGKWQSRYFIVKDTFIAYIRPKDGIIKSVILMDNGFGISCGMYTTGLRNGIQIVNLSRHILIKCWTKRKAKEWMEFIQEVSNKEGRDFIQSNPHNSFAPYRSPISASWFVDGSSYMYAIADALEGAKEEIFIADWWLSPEIYMKRPALDSNYWRLDKILERKAFEGVKIFIMIYKEVEVALGINSFYSKQRLVEKCPDNIKVLRHPDHARVGVFFWAHHEKIVVVDQSIAFLGGIDLCYGRWDNNEHRLIDLGSTHQSSIYIPSKGRFTNTSSKKVSNANVNKHVLLSLAIATNTVVMATTRSIPVLPVMSSKSPMPLALSQLNTEDLFLMQSVDETDTMKCDTPSVERKNLFGMAKDTMDKVKHNIKIKRQEFINMVYNPHEESSDEENVMNTDTTPTPFEATELMAYNKDLHSDYPGVTKLWLGKDYVNFIVKDFNDLEKPYQDLVDRSNTPRMPWHDIGVMVQGATARDMEKAKLNSCYPFLLPKSYKNCKSSVPFIEESAIHNVKCQVLRSVSSWSAGFLDSETIEQSIQEAYIEAISFEGEVGGPTGTALRAITHWNYASISRSRGAILNRLNEAGIEDPSEYITFHGLRTHAMLNGTLVTELIYVHSKLLIVDDNTVICGSANINDRSMIATRDSEIAVIIHDQEFEDGRMNDIPFPCGKFAGSLRKQLISEHLGLFKTNENMDITDIIKKSFYRDIWRARSNQNTEIYEEVFHCIPTDKVVNFSMLKQYQDEEPLSLSNPLSAQEMGHLVNMPLNFLSNEDLKPTAGTVEGIMPTALWT
ncbi:Phospholipase D1 [Eufriesea mexicana]|uniref:Phospholipase n=1 Tax=Eufriesea mexicana TaxID=516756 RepID=A0A310SLW0_9HYME|nr:Phospholipase D1 [Eufriesea mexicana]